jgi:hypothetical protein
MLGKETDSQDEQCDQKVFVAQLRKETCHMQARNGENVTGNF